MTCIKHKTYQAKRKPRTSCLTCWEIWFKKHSDENVSGEEVESILSAIDIELEESMEQSMRVNHRLEQLKKMHDFLHQKIDKSLVT